MQQRALRELCSSALCSDRRERGQNELRCCAGFDTVIFCLSNFPRHMLDLSGDDSGEITRGKKVAVIPERRQSAVSFK